MSYAISITVWHCVLAVHTKNHKISTGFTNAETLFSTNVGALTLTSFFHHFLLSVMPFCGCSYKMLLNELQCVLLHFAMRPVEKSGTTHYFSECGTPEFVVSEHS